MASQMTQMSVKPLMLFSFILNSRPGKIYWNQIGSETRSTKYGFIERGLHG